MANTQSTPLSSIEKWCNAGHHFVLRTYFSRDASRSDGLQIRCKECQAKYQYEHSAEIKARSKQWREENKEKIKTSRHAQYWLDPELSRAKRRESHHKNADRVNQKRKAAYDADPETYREQKRVWYQANLEKMKSINRRAYERKRDKPAYKEALRRNGKIYYQRHPEKVKAKSHRRRSAKGMFTSSQWLAKCEYFGWRCYLCFTPLTIQTASPDHRKAIISGGSNWIANIAPACRYCNAAKRDLSESDYRQRIHAGLTRITLAEEVTG